MTLAYRYPAAIKTADLINSPTKSIPPPAPDRNTAEGPWPQEQGMGNPTVNFIKKQ